MADRSVRVTFSANVAGFQAAMAKAQESTKQLIAEVSKTSQTESWKKASTGLLAFGATAMSVGVMAAKSFADFDQAMANVGAATNTPRESLGQLSDLALKLGADTKFSATEAAGGIEELAKAGLSTADIIGGGLSGALDLAATDTLSVGDAAGYTATTLTQFNLSGDQASHVADLLAAGAGKAMGSVKDMADALNNGGLVASQMGMSLEQTVGTLSAFAQNGIIGAEAGTQLKVMLQRLQNPAADAREAMKQLGVSAYDAQGKFVGLDAVAGQLQNGTKGLTQAQKDQALATIFGSHAINAANVLLKEGAQGIQDWTGKVNDQGYASEVAAKKMDSLKGDLEKLGGAWETLMIKSGEASNGPLRGAVQLLTNLVDFLGENSTASSIIISIAAGLGGLALAAGGVMKATTAVSEFKTALDTLKAADGILGKIVGSLGGFGKAIPIIGGVVLALGLYRSAIENSQATKEATLDQEAFTAAMERMTSASSGAAEQLDQLFASQQHALGSNTELLDSVNGFAEALRRAATENGFNNFVDDMATKLTGSKNLTQKSREEISLFDEKLSGLVSSNMPAAQQTFSLMGQKIREMNDSMQHANLSAGEALAAFPKTTEAMQKYAEETTGAKLSQQELEHWLQGTPPAAVAVSQAMINAGVSADVFSGKLDSNSQAAKAGAQSLSEVVSGIDAWANAALKGSGSAIGLEAAIDDATAAVQKNGATTDINTAAGRANQSALDSIASSALKLRDAQVENGATTETMTASTQRARDAFVATAQQMGMNAQQANDLADKYGLIPATVTTDVSVPGAKESRESMKRLYDQIMALPDEKKTWVMSLLNSGGIDAARAGLDSLKDKTVTVRVNVEKRNWDIGADGIPTTTLGHSAAGGMITGPGTGTSDSILMMLSNGEFVQRARAVDYYGPAFMHALNSLSIPKSQLPHFAHGGEVTPRFNTVDRTGGYRAAASPVVAPVIQQVSPQAIAQAVAAVLPAALHGATLTLTPDGRTAMAGFIGTQVAGVAAAATGSRYR
ncbi:phage tail tape measure protein [Propionibacterium freudenreichii]|uniref:phage tail tape measure protein n=3 Tax=Propionibacterium freudenreichii TaxID=1744 RepID=UPI003851B483